MSRLGLSWLDVELRQVPCLWLTMETVTDERAIGEQAGATGMV